jgi:alpha-galactosidase
LSNSSRQCTIDVGDETIRLSNGVESVTYSFRLGTFTYATNEGRTTFFSRAYLRVNAGMKVFDTRKMVYKGVNSIDFGDESNPGKVLIIRLEDPEKDAEINIRLSMNLYRTGYSIILQFKNRNNEIAVQSLDPLVIDIDTDTRLFTGWTGTDLRFFRNGFHSWELTQAVPIEIGENLSHLFTVINNILTKQALVIGFITSANQLTTVSVFGRNTEENKLGQVVASSITDGIQLGERETIVSEELYIQATDEPRKALEQYVDVLANRMEGVKWSNVHTGWCSWYFYFTRPDETEVIANAEFIKDRFADKIEWVEIDDGYQTAVGDWHANSRFRGGLGSLSKRINSLGMKSGIWVAPFIASEHSILFKDKPNWFIKDKDDEPIVVGENPLWLGKFYALDLTRPQVIEYIERVFRELKKHGFEYFKIDFLHYAAVLGKRFDLSILRGKAIRLGLEAIRRAVGESFVLGCGAPLGPCIGLVNGMRIGTDIGTVWKYEWGGGVYGCAINTMTRAFMHRRLWVNDPDCILVRQEDNNLTLDEIQLWATIVALSGGLLFLGDKMTEVSEDRLRILHRLLPHYQKSAVALDYLEEANPQLFVLPIVTSLGQWAVIAAINLTEKPIDIICSIRDIGLDDEIPYHIFDFWNETYEGLFEKRIEVQALKPHSCQFMCIRPESRVPCVLATTIHFTQGAVELADQSWDEEKRELEVKVTRETQHAERVFFVYNNRWKPNQAFIDERIVELERVAPEVVAVRQKFQPNQYIRLTFSKSI